MNEHDSERLSGLLESDGMTNVDSVGEADVVVINTCCIRENADDKFYGTLSQLKNWKTEKDDRQILVAGCLAQKDRDLIRERAPYVDVVIGTHNVHRAAELLEETRYGRPVTEILEEAVLDDHTMFPSALPMRREVSYNAWVTIQIGCDNTCAYCIVPAVRGREISRPFEGIVDEVRGLAASGVTEIFLLGQNVNSYLWFGGGPKKEFKKLTQDEQDSSVDFADLLEMCATAVPHMRIRYSTSHPRDINEKVVHTMAKYKNLCNYIHLPAQSGNTRVLDIMSRNYTREWYMDKIRMIRSIIPDCGISCDIIAGFCSETEEEHQDTLSLIDWAEFEFSYMYIYSERPGTPAAKKLVDDVADEVKSRRLSEIIALQNAKSKAKNESYIGKVVTVLIEGHSKKSTLDWKGRSDQNSVTIFPCEEYKIGDLVNVMVERATTTAMIGKAIGYASLID